MYHYENTRKPFCSGALGTKRDIMVLLSLQLSSFRRILTLKDWTIPGKAMTNKISTNFQKPVLATSKNTVVVRNGVFVGSTLLAIVAGSLAATGVTAIICGNKLSEHNTVEGNVGALIFFVGVCVLFSLIARHQYRQTAALNELERERAILAFAKQEGRAITIPEVALSCSIRIVDAASVLNRLTARGVCQMDISEEGELIYSFTNGLRAPRLTGY